MRLRATRLGAISTGRRFVPTLDLNFTTGALGPLVTFSRASSGSRFNSSGLMVIESTNVPRFDYNPATLAARGLLIEPQRTNLLLNSDTLNTQDVTVSAVDHALSFYGTGTITLSGVYSGALVGTGVNNRVTLTFTPTAGTLTVTVSGSVRYANLEQGKRASSWIQTLGSTATRAADVANITGTNFSSWFNATEGTFVVEYIATAALTDERRYLLNFNDGGNNRLALRGSDAVTPTPTLAVGTSTGAITIISTVTPTSFAITKAAAAYGPNSALSVNAETPLINATVNSVVASQLAIGQASMGLNSLNAWFRRIRFYPRRLPNATVQALSAP